MSGGRLVPSAGVEEELRRSYMYAVGMYIPDNSQSRGSGVGTGQGREMPLIRLSTYCTSLPPPLGSRRRHWMTMLKK